LVLDLVVAGNEVVEATFVFVAIAVAAVVVAGRATAGASFPCRCVQL
jgi:hypothetical protein